MSPNMGLACCPYDGTPLISTMAFSGAEFLCLHCGSHLGFLQPRGVQDDPEKDAEYERLQAEWDANVDGKLLYGWRTDCPQCEPRGEYHDAHATPEEKAEHEAAIRWINERVAQAAAT